MSKLHAFYRYGSQIALLLAVTMGYATPVISPQPVSNLSMVDQNAAKVDINHANVATLSKVKGIGDKRARAIVSWRQQHGRFQTVEDLGHIKGFSHRRLKRLSRVLVAK